MKVRNIPVVITATFRVEVDDHTDGWFLLTMPDGTPYAVPKNTENSQICATAIATYKDELTALLESHTGLGKVKIINPVTK